MEPLQGCPGPEKPRLMPRLLLWLWVGLRRVRSAPQEGCFTEAPESFKVDAHQATCGKILRFLTQQNLVNNQSEAANEQK